MPILKKEPDVYPEDLLASESLLEDDQRSWWCVYTLSRREKDLMRKMVAWKIPFYSPVIQKRFRSPNGRLRTSYIPLFPNYVFLFASDSERAKSMTTNCISRYQPIPDASAFVSEMRVIQQLVLSGVPLTPEAKLEIGDRARIRTGPFAGYEGTIIRREGKTRFLVCLSFIEQGVSMEIDEGQLAPV